jgi:enterochelin esterase-like enzyme
LPQAAFPTVPFAPDCADEQGSVTNYNYHAYTLGYSLFYDVYLPPCYAASGESYSVLYLLHGQAFIEDQWDRLGADEAADSLIASGQAPPFIMVMPRGGANPYFGQGLVDDLMPFVESTYRIKGDRAHRAIGGLSRGGGWAIYLGLLHPDLFSAIGGHSPAIQYVHAPEIDNLLDELPAGEVPRIWLDIGDTDSLIGNTKWLTEMLDERGIPFTFNLFAGRHEEAYWAEHMPEYILFYAEGW